MIKRLAIIPARSGSKRIPNKNIREFCGKPIISYIIEAAKKSSLFDVVHVSTDNYNIKSVVEGLGLQIDFMRPSELSGDEIPLMPVLKFVADTFEGLGHKFHEIWMLMPCAPLIEAEDLVVAAKKFQLLEGRQAIIAVGEYPAPIEWAYLKTSLGTLKPVQPEAFSIRSQDFNKKYYDAGAFIAFPEKYIVNSDQPLVDLIWHGYVLPKFKTVDIDEEEDWVLAELLFKSKFYHNQK